MELGQELLEPLMSLPMELGQELLGPLEPLVPLDKLPLPPLMRENLTSEDQESAEVDTHIKPKNETRTFWLFKICQFFFKILLLL